MIITDFYIKYKDIILPADNFYPKFDDVITINTEYQDSNVKAYFDTLVNCDGSEFKYLRKIILRINNRDYIFVNIR